MGLAVSRFKPGAHTWIDSTVSVDCCLCVAVVDDLVRTREVLGEELASFLCSSRAFGLQEIQI